jgi:hypothetical protein
MQSGAMKNNKYQTLAIKYYIADGTCNIFCNTYLLLGGTLAKLEKIF